TDPAAPPRALLPSRTRRSARARTARRPTTGRMRAPTATGRGDLRRPGTSGGSPPGGPYTALRASMAVADPVSYETRLRPRFAVIAAIGGVCLFAAAALQAAGPQAKVSELTVQLLVTNKRGSLEVIGTIVNGFG